jgi:hypothetical protein
MVIFAQGEQRTIPDTVAISGMRPGESSQMVVSGVAGCENNCTSVAQVLADTELALIATVGEPRGYLSEDRRTIYTDYSIEQPIVLFQQRLALFATDQPSAITVLGGTANVNGVRYTVLHSALPFLPAGKRCLFLLRKAGRQYRLAGDYYGAFEITGSEMPAAISRINPLVGDKQFGKEYAEMPAQAALGEIVATLMATQKRETLPEAVLRNGAGIHQTYAADYTPKVTLAGLAKGSDLIVRATVEQGHARLSKDETSIESDYLFRPTEYLWSRSTEVRSEPVILTAAGGFLTIDKYKVSGVDPEVPVFDVGGQYLLFMRFDPISGHFLLTHGGQSAFLIRGEVGKEFVIQLSSKRGAYVYSTKWSGPPPLFAVIDELQSALQEELKK